VVVFGGEVDPSDKGNIQPVEDLNIIKDRNYSATTASAVPGSVHTLTLMSCL
jgi:hypothetical protein